jgi:hypothetical protein
MEYCYSEPAFFVEEALRNPLFLLSKPCFADCLAVRLPAGRQGMPLPLLRRIPSEGASLTRNDCRFTLWQ